MCGDECVRVLPDEQNYQEEPPRDKLVFEVYGALLPPKLKTLQEPLHDLTRIRPKFWVFQEKCPFFGPNRIAFGSSWGQNGYHGSDGTRRRSSKQTKTARSSAERDPAQTLQHPH